MLLTSVARFASAAHVSSEWVSTEQFGDWTNAINWSPQVMPGNGNGDTYDVVIAQPDVYQVTLAADMEINALTLSNRLLE